MRRYSKRELRTILGEALRESPAPIGRDGISELELEEAAEQAGIGSLEVREAVRRLDRRRSLRLSLGLVALAAGGLVAALVLLPTSRLLGWRGGALRLHNEHRQAAFTLEVLVPSHQQAPERCQLAPEARHATSDYCLLRRVRLEPRRRASVSLPDSLGPCPQVWVRALSSGSLRSSAIFTLPVAIEVDHRGRLDQKGAGAPHQHPPPDTDLANPHFCPSN